MKEEGYGTKGHDSTVNLYNVERFNIRYFIIWLED